MDGDEKNDEKCKLESKQNEKASAKELESRQNGEASAKEVTQRLSVDDMLSFVGEFGLFQRVLEVMFCFCIIGVAYPILIMYFAGHSPAWECTANSTYCNFNNTMPHYNKSRCDMPRDAWRFTKSRSYTIVTQYDLQCEREWLVPMSISMMFIGWAIGAVVLGWVADNYGRRIVLFPSLGLLFMLCFLSAFLPNIESFIAARFLIGFVIPGTSVQMFIMMSELVGSTFRPFAGMALWFFWTVSLCALALQAYFVREWKILYIITSLPYLIVLAFWKFVPESIRWLNIKGRTDEAMSILQRVANFNKRTIPDGVTLKAHKKALATHKSSPLDLFRTWVLASRTAIQGFSWFTSGLVYYGLSIAADELGGSRYLNFMLSSMVEFPAVVVAILGCNYFGRKKTIVIPMFIGSLSCFAVAFIPLFEPWRTVRQAIGIFGKFCVTLAFDSLYTWSVEIYPTVLRSQAMGFLQVTSRLGAASSPWVAKAFVNIHPKAPFIAMATVGFIASVSMCWLPETKGKQTAETMEEEAQQEEREGVQLLDIASAPAAEENGNAVNFRKPLDV